MMIQPKMGRDTSGPASRNNATPPRVRGKRSNSQYEIPSQRTGRPSGPGRAGDINKAATHLNLDDLLAMYAEKEALADMKGTRRDVMKSGIKESPSINRQMSQKDLADTLQNILDQYNIKLNVDDVFHPNRDEMLSKLEHMVLDQSAFMEGGNLRGSITGAHKFMDKMCPLIESCAFLGTGVEEELKRSETIGFDFGNESSLADSFIQEGAQSNAFTIGNVESRTMGEGECPFSLDDIDEFPVEKPIEQGKNAPHKSPPRHSMKYEGPLSPVQLH